MSAFFHGWKLEVIQLEPRGKRARAFCASCGTHRILRLHAGSSLVLRGSVRKGWSCAVLSSAQEAPVRVLGHHMDRKELLLAGAQASVDLFVPNDGILNLIVGADGRSVSGRLPRMFVATDETVDRMSAVFDVLDRHGQPRSGTVRSLASELLRAAEASREVARAALITTRVKAVVSACRLIDARFPAALTLRELAEHCGVAERTLEYGFQEVYDTTPLTFSKCQRLSRNRVALLRPGESGLVSEFARASGFTHMGQYSIDYRRHFGERPSATLARAG